MIKFIYNRISKGANGYRISSFAFYFKGSEEGKNLAQCIQSSILKNVEMEKQRDIKENDNYYLLKNTGKTMVIVECGFLSNRREADLLIQPQYQQKDKAGKGPVGTEARETLVHE